MQVRDLEGRTWTVRRRWLPRHENVGRRLLRQRAERRAARAVRAAQEPKRERDDRWFDWLSPLDFLDDLGFALIVIAALVFVLFWGWPFLVALLDVLFVLLLTLVGVVARIVFRRPWLVEATAGDARLTRSVVGWRASGRAVATWAEELRHGRGQEGGTDGAGLLS